MPVKPPAPKHTSEDLGNELVISIPSPKYWPLIIFFGIWVIINVAGELVVLGLLTLNRIGPDGPSVPIIVLIMIFWTVAVALLFYSFAWQAFGKEVVEITTQSISIRRVTLGHGSQKEYTADHIKDLRVASSNMDSNHPMLITYNVYYYPWYHPEIGSMAFDYGARTFRFGSGIDEAEAKQIIAEIKQKFPQYKN